MVKHKLTFEQHDMISNAVWDYAEQFDDLNERAEELELLADNDSRSAMDEVIDMLDLDNMPDDIDAIKDAIADKADEILCDPGAWEDYMNKACSC